MFNFCQFWNQINGEPYHNVPPPVNYNLASYTQAITTSPLNNVEGKSTYELRPITHEDMGSASAEDVVNNYRLMHGGKNPCRLGDPMSDEEFKRFYGQTW